MPAWVVKRVGDGAFLQRPGAPPSFTRELAGAWLFETQAAAVADRPEPARGYTVVPVPDDIMAVIVGRRLEKVRQ